jgi:hypothetical protein
MTDANAKGTTKTVTSVGTVSNITRSAAIYHTPSLCPSPSSCYYLFSVYFNGTNGPMKSSLIISHETNISQTVELSDSYVNIIAMGTY